MKLKNVLLGASMLTVMGIVATSCTNEMVNPLPGGPSANGKSSMLVQAPDIYAWSGQQNLTSTRSDGLDESIDWSTVTFSDCQTDLLVQYWEKKWVEEYLPEKNENIKEDVRSDFLFYADKNVSLEFYPVYSMSWTEKKVGIFYYDAQGNYKEELVWDGVKVSDCWKNNGNNHFIEDPDHQYGGEWWEDQICYGKKINIPAGCVFGFYWNGNFNPNYDGCLNGEGNWDSSTTYYSVSKWNYNIYRTDGERNLLNGDTSESNKSQVHGVTFELNGKTYLGLEDWSDFDFQDLVFTCAYDLIEMSPDDLPEKGENLDKLPPIIEDGYEKPDQPTNGCPGTFDEDGEKCDHPKSSHNPDGSCNECEDGEPCYKPTTPSQPGEDNCPNCPHEKHEGDCPQCDEGTVCHPGDGTGGSDEHPFLHNDEVEVNYSINDVHTDKNGQKYENADLWTKLSIHVRKGTDVKIHVPLPGKYFCESDDFAILQSHYEGIYTGTEGANEVPGKWNEGKTLYTHSMTYHIRGDKKEWDVILTVTINNEGMDIETSGIDQDLIDYLFEVNGDGINFELWNYYQTQTVSWIDDEGNELEKSVVNSTLTQDEYDAFQGYLDQATIEFLDADPSYYINAYGYEWSNGKYTTDIRHRDCRVTPLSPTHDNDFDRFSKYCYHLNGTPWNIIWVNKKVDHEDPCYEAHTTTPDPAVDIYPVESARTDRNND